MLLVEDRMDLEDVHDILSPFPEDEIISAHSALVMLQSFPTMEYIPIAALPDRIDVDDPRYNPYLRNVPNYFTVEHDDISYHILYLMRDRPVLSLYYVLYHLFKAHDVQWFLPGNSFSLRIIVLMIFWGIVCFLLLFRHHGHRISLLLSALPLSILASLGGVPTLILSGVWYMSWCRVVVVEFRSKKADKSSVRARKTRVWLQYGIIVLGCMILQFISFGTALFPAFLTVCIALPALLCAIFFYDLYKQRRYEHRLFRRVYIVPVQVKLSDYFPDKPLVSLFVATFLLLALFLPLNLWGGGVKIPSPLSPPNFTHQWYENMKSIWEHKAGLPDIADYLAHVAMQEKIPFQQRVHYQLPELNAELGLSRFRRLDGKIERSEESIMIFDAKWFQETLQSSIWPSHHNLLLSQSQYSSIGFVAEKMYNNKISEEIFALFVVCSTFPLFFILGKRSEKYDEVF